jgi:hypothetical protein
LTVTHENTGAACMSGKGMSKAELALLKAWVKKEKAAAKLKS